MISNSFPANSSPKKPPRPISAVPSEYSDVSTSSCRTTSDEGDLESESKSSISINTNANTDTNTVSIVVNSDPVPVQSKIVSDQVPTSPPDDFLSKEARMVRVYRIASELLSTEEQYVTVLYLIDQVSQLFVYIFPFLWTFKKSQKIVFLLVKSLLE